MVLAAFEDYRSHFDQITRGAPERFAVADWSGLHHDVVERLELYNRSAGEAVAALRAAIGDGITDRAAWIEGRREFAAAAVTHSHHEIATTFFSSVTRRVMHTEGTDAAIEFTDDATVVTAGMPRTDAYDVAGDPAATLAAMLRKVFPGQEWQNLERDVRLAAKELERDLALYGVSGSPQRIEVLPDPFYRGRAAYVVGRLEAGALSLPLVLAVHQTSRGLVIGAVLVELDDVSVLFSYTRSSFLVHTDHPGQLVNYLSSLLPHRKRAELYTAIGYDKHGKTERYRDLRRYLATADDRFEYARGIRGMVMIVFTLPGYDAVFKVIRDRFPYPKQTTRRQVMGKYRLVFRHDRAGRLIDAHEFEHMRFDRDRFDRELLDELAGDAGRSVSVDGDTVVLHHVYMERKVIPLDIYVRESNPVKARAAIVDYGRAIKNLALSDVFPGDMLLKNFGVTRSGRIVFYDYDELTRLTECNFRELPQTTDPEQEMAADPWFGVGDKDVFPEEFTRFLGIRGELRDVLMEHHADLFGVRFWKRVQDRVRSGEIIEIFPYRRTRRLGAGVRRRTLRE